MVIYSTRTGFIKHLFKATDTRYFIVFGWLISPNVCNATIQYCMPVFLDEREEHDTTGRTQYASACDRLGIVPVSYFSRHITDQEIVMRYHGLGPLGAKAIAKVLRV